MGVLRPLTDRIDGRSLRTAALCCLDPGRANFAGGAPTLRALNDIRPFRRPASKRSTRTLGTDQSTCVRSRALEVCENEESRLPKRIVPVRLRCIPHEGKKLANSRLDLNFDGSCAGPTKWACSLSPSHGQSWFIGNPC